MTQANFVKEVVVTDPDSKAEVEMSVFKHSNTMIHINGHFNLDFYYLNSSKVTDENEVKEITKKLKNSNYSIDMKNRLVNGNNSGNPLYTFTISPTDNITFKF